MLYKKRTFVPIHAQLITLPTWVLLLLFVAPLFIALIIYINWNNMYFAECNKGIHVSPPFNLQLQAHFDIKDALIHVDPTAKHWNAIYIAPIKCSKSCQQRKDNLAKMYEKLGHKHHNIDLFAIPSPLVKIYNNSRYQALLLKENTLFITDPNNEVVMYYDANTTTARILKDLTKLLTTEPLNKDKKS